MYCEKHAVNDLDGHGCWMCREAAIVYLRDKLHKAEVARDGWMKNYNREVAHAASLEAKVEEYESVLRTMGFAI